MKIVRARKSDFEEYYKLKQEESEEYKLILGSYLKIPLKNQLKKEFFDLISSKKNIILLAKINKTIGYLNFTIFNNIWNKGIFIDDLFVKKEFRKQRIATSLMKECVKIVEKKKLKKILLGVLINNKKAINLYKKFGFNFRRYEMEKKLK